MLWIAFEDIELDCNCTGPRILAPEKSIRTGQLNVHRGPVHPEKLIDHCRLKLWISGYER